MAWSWSGFWFLVAAGMVVVWLRSEAARAAEQCEYRQRIDAARRVVEEIEAEHHEPGSVTLFQAACEKARLEDAEFEAAVLDDIERLP